MASGLDLATCDKLLTTTRSVRLRFDLERPGTGADRGMP